jgi:hypothetical protein
MKLNINNIFIFNITIFSIVANGKRADAVGLLLANGANVDQKHAQGE